MIIPTLGLKNAIIFIALSSVKFDEKFTAPDISKMTGLTPNYTSMTFRALEAKGLIEIIDVVKWARGTVRVYKMTDLGYETAHTIEKAFTKALDGELCQENFN